MPRYHLNLFDEQGPAPDDEGQDFEDLGSARDEAIRGIRSILADELLMGAITLGGRIEIADEDGRLLQTIDFSEAVEIRR